MITTPIQTVNKIKAMTNLTKTIENAIPVSAQMLTQLDADGVEYDVIMQSESMTDYVWIQVIPTTKSLLGLFHAGVHFGISKLKAA